MESQGMKYGSDRDVLADLCPVSTGLKSCPEQSHQFGCQEWGTRQNAPYWGPQTPTLKSRTMEGDLMAGLWICWDLRGHKYLYRYDRTHKCAQV
jgi:hypothetical protein